MSAPMTLTVQGNSSIRARRRSPAASAPESDQFLLKQVVKRQPQALAKLYERYASRALGLAFRMLRDRDLAEQAIQDAFYKVWQHAAEFEPKRASFSTWLFTIVRNLCIDQLRSRRKEESLDDGEQMENLEAHLNGPDVGETVNRRLVSEQIRAALRALPEAQRRVLELAYLEGYTRREIAAQLDEPVGTIHTRARLGLEKLAAMLDV